MSETNHKTPAVGEEPIFTAAMYGSSQAAMQAQIEYLIEDRERMKHQLSEHRKNADRFQVVAGLFDETKNSRCERVLDDLGLDGDPVSPFALIIDQHQGITDLPSTNHWPVHLRALLEQMEVLAGALQSVLDEGGGGLAAEDARAELEQTRRWLARASYQSEGSSPAIDVPMKAITLILDTALQSAVDHGVSSVDLPDAIGDVAEWQSKLQSSAVEQAQQMDPEAIVAGASSVPAASRSRTPKEILGLREAEFGEGYVEVPVGVLERMVRLVKADLAYDLAHDSYNEHERNDLPFAHPAVRALREAIRERAEALTSYRESLDTPSS
jgi:hypothetical protein